MSNLMMMDDSWTLTESQFDAAEHRLYETLFALGNGYVGLRGSFLEGLDGASTPGTFINGFYEREAITYGELAYGFPREKQVMLNVANPLRVEIMVEDERLDLNTGRLLDYNRELNMQQGTLTRRLIWESPTGRCIKLVATRAVLHAREHNAVVHLTVEPLNFDGTIVLRSGIDARVTNLSSDDDPRIGAGVAADALRVVETGIRETQAWMVQQTHTTQFQVTTVVEHRLSGASADVQPFVATDWLGLQLSYQLTAGTTVTVDKQIAWVTSLDDDNPLPAAQQAAMTARQDGTDALLMEQEAFLVSFWEGAAIDVDGHPEMARGLRFNLFHLLQSTGRNGRTNIAAKGLTGQGYEGHYFWDTEIYILPFFLFTQPVIARQLLAYRYHILDRARARARELAHSRGALFPWRTINGDECSAYFPAGTAQFHINADIAYAVVQYHRATGDDAFMREMGAEILFETARVWADMGHFDPQRNGQFSIHSVTGPDEYTAIVDNNAYTNLMAAANLRAAAETHAWLAATAPERLAELVATIALEEGEPAGWQAAADKMYIPTDPARGIIAQDDTFLHKPVWDFDGTPSDKYPLLLHFHPLVIYRHQVCKQADTVLAHYLLSDAYDVDQQRRDFDYYEAVTTHDSSLSACIFGIMASAVGYDDKAYQYFVATALTDLENKKGNTKDGIHAANMGGAWLSLVAGFGGMRLTPAGLSLAPKLPTGWVGYAFNLRYRGRLLHVAVTAAGTELTLHAGAALTLTLHGETVTVAAAPDGDEEE